MFGGSLLGGLRVVCEPLWEVFIVLPLIVSPLFYSFYSFSLMMSPVIVYNPVSLLYMPGSLIYQLQVKWVYNYNTALLQGTESVWTLSVYFCYSLWVWNSFFWTILLLVGLAIWLGHICGNFVKSVCEACVCQSLSGLPSCVYGRSPVVYHTSYTLLVRVQWPP